MKLGVEVVGAHDLPARRRGGVSPFVQVDFGGQRHATAVRPASDLNPTWNETLVFFAGAAGGGGGGRLPERSIDVAVYHRRASGGKSCLGRVRLFGAAVAPSREEAVLLRCPLDKPGFFAPARGEVALRLYMAPYTSPSSSGAGAAGGAANAPAPNTYSATRATTTLDDDAASAAGPETVVGGASTQSAPAMRTKRPKKKEPPPPVRVFHSLPAQSSTGSLIYPPPPPFMPPPAGDPKGAKKAQAATGENAKAAAHLIVDQLEFLYVNVVCARGLPGMDLTLGVDPYVEVRVGNYCGITRHLKRNHNPEWNQVFAFFKENLQADSLEVIIKDRNLIIQDGFVGKVVLPILEVPNLAPPNGPLAPQWYRLRGAKDQWTGGEIKLAAWKGTQADGAFAGALHADTHDMVPSAVLATQTKSYYTPRLCYLRCHIIAAQDLVHPDRSRSRPAVFARVELDAQRWETRVAPDRSLSPKWDEDFFLVAAWPFEEPLVITVMDVVSPERHEVLGRLVLPKGSIKVQQLDKKKFKPPPPWWFDLEQQPHSGDGDGVRDRGWRHEFRSKIQLRVYYDAAYHVLDEPAAYASDFQPSARPLRSPPIGVLELGILRATGLPSPATPPNGGRRRNADAYCVAKYGQKWIRTRTLLDTASPSWQEQFTFDVFDPCTVLTVAVFNNNQLAGAGESSRRGASDAPLGKVRVRVSTLASGRTYEHPYALFVVHPGRLLRCGELRLAVRFTHTAWARVTALYLRPPLPSQHFARPIPAHLAAELRRRAADAVAARLARAEPPLRPEAVLYVLRDPRAHPSAAVPERDGGAAYSLRKYHAACARLRGVLVPAGELARWLRRVRDWESPATTVLALLVFLTLTWRPSMILPTLFLYLVAAGAWNFRRRPARPEQMEHYADGVPPAMLEEEFDAGAASGTPPEIVAYRYWALRETATRVQELVGDVAGQAERVQALLEWRDGRATAIALAAAAALAAVFYAVPVRAVVAVAGVYWMRHPAMRKRKGPSPLVSFFRRLPSNADVMF
ncbi:hypothetical protein ACP4OV_014647 [Aristida adscensionis]